MRAYEVVYILRPDLEKEDVSRQVEKFKNIITSGNGEIIDLQEWGKRRLAYEIRKFNEGYYVLMQFKGDPALTRELERVFRISDEVIRFLVIHLED